MESICITKERMKVRIIEAKLKDDGDYDYIYDNAVHNTLNEYWKWAETSKGTVSFKKEYEDIGYTLTLCVDAVFEEPEDYALFKITYGGKPFTKLQINNMMEGQFVHD
jgi:hypothetical protein